MSLQLSVYTLVSVIVLISSDTVTGDEFQTPESCQDEIFCTEKPDNYEQLQGEIEEKMAGIREKFNFNYFSETDWSEDSSDEELYERINCPTTSEIIKPYTVKVNFTTKLVVQTSFYEQKFRETKCAYHLISDVSPSESECFDGISTSIKGKCKQKDTQISIYLYNKEKQVIERYPVSIPVCCYCDISNE